MTTATRSQFVSTVVENTPLCREHYRLTLRLNAFPPTQPGQFVQVSCRPMDAEADCDIEREWNDQAFPQLQGVDLSHPSAVLRRPFSLAGRRDFPGGVDLSIIHRVVGIGTHWLSELSSGDNVHLLGPLGNRFALPGPDQPAILVGGGVGIPPMLYLAAHLSGRNAVAFCGALSRDLLPFGLINDSANPVSKGDASQLQPAKIEPAKIQPSMVVREFAEHGIPSVITTDDGSFGYRGFVTQALEAYLDQNPTSKPIIYTCGPEPMMKRVADIANQRGLPTQIAVERAMACGMGTCQSCVIKVRRPSKDGRDWVYRLACTDGPVFSGDRLLW